MCVSGAALLGWLSEQRADDELMAAVTRVCCWQGLRGCGASLTPSASFSLSHLLSSFSPKALMLAQSHFTAPWAATNVIITSTPVCFLACSISIIHSLWLFFFIQRWTARWHPSCGLCGIRMPCSACYGRGTPNDDNNY